MSRRLSICCCRILHALISMIFCFVLSVVRLFSHSLGTLNCQYVSHLACHNKFGCCFVLSCNFIFNIFFGFFFWLFICCAHQSRLLPRFCPISVFSPFCMRNSRPFLHQPTVCFCYTCMHCSWLNVMIIVLAVGLLDAPLKKFFYMCKYMETYLHENTHAIIVYLQ